MRKGYETMRCGLLGEHLGHSFSPRIHGELADYSYDIVELPPEAVGEFVKSGGYDAFNVTIPYKKAVMPFLDRISPEAAAIGAVNTVVRRPDGTLDGYNTDYFGFDAMITASGIDVKGAKALVLGNGGASVTVCAVLRDRGAREILVFDLKGANSYDTLPLHADADIIVNATPVGMYPKNGVSLADLSLFPRCRGVLDLVYNPSRTALILDAEARGIPCRSGLYMLVAQAAKALEFFTGEAAEEGAIEAITAKIAADTQNLILIGMPGCGKSTIGKLVAQRLERPFHDADEVFTDTYGKTPAQVIEAEGEEQFRRMEHDVLCELGKLSGAVISCGGGVVTREENYTPLHQNGVLIYLRRELSRLATGGRPLSQRTSPEALYEARRASYERFADLTVDSTEMMDRTTDAMIAAYAEYMKG